MTAQASRTQPRALRTPRRNPAAKQITFSGPAAPQGPPKRYVDGVEVLREVPVEHLPGKPFRISRLYLADETVTFGCRDCVHTGTRGEIMAHRNASHGASIGRKRAKVVQEPLGGGALMDVIVPERADGPPPDAIYDMTMRELLAVFPSITALGDLIAKVEAERDELLSELNVRRANDRSNQHKIDTYDELRDEVTTLRQQMRSWGNYEQVKQEMYELKAWKKKMTTKLQSLGFVMTEEE